MRRHSYYTLQQAQKGLESIMKAQTEENCTPENLNATTDATATSDCMEENNFGDSSASPENSDAPSTALQVETPDDRTCPQCGSPLYPGQNFCSKCGTPSYSIVPLSPEKQKEKQKKGLLISVLAALILLVVGTCVFLIVNSIQTKRQQEAEASRIASESASRSASEEAARIAAEESSKAAAEAAKRAFQAAKTQYLKDANSFSSSILDTCVVLEDIGNDIQSYWYDYIYEDRYSSIEDAVDNAEAANADNISSAKFTKIQLDALYVKLLKLPEDGDGNTEYALIKEAATTLYDAYCNLYDCIIHVSGSYKSFTAAFSEYDSAVGKEYSTFYALVESYSGTVL